MFAYLHGGAFVGTRQAGPRRAIFSDWLMANAWELLASRELAILSALNFAGMWPCGCGSYECVVRYPLICNYRACEVDNIYAYARSSFCANCDLWKSDYEAMV